MRPRLSDGGGQIRNVRTSGYKRFLGELPAQVATLADEAFKLFCANPNHPALNHHELKNTKKGRHRTGSWSVAVSYRYRAIYVVDGDDRVWYWIGSHEDYNNFVGLK